MIHRENRTDWIKAFYASAVEWWGESWYDGENLKARLQIIQQYGSQEDQRILELGAGTGETAAYLCEHGYSVVAVDICRKNVELINAMRAKRPSLSAIEGDFLSVAIPGRFPIVCMFETFGLGSDRNQRKLLERVYRDWLEDNGVFILDVYHPCGPIKAAGTQRSLDRLAHVPGSVDMTEYSLYDGVKNRWIDIWEPVNDKASARVQSIRCYTPADLLLLLDGTGFVVQKMLYKGQAIDFENAEIKTENVFEDSERNYAYTVILEKK
ncbi:MAG: class I SAM-dependent methyltransferase [Chloroflexota bacterium]